MQAAIFLGPERMEMRKTPKPEYPREGALLRVKSCALCGTDVRIYYHGHPRIREPRIIGHEVSGVVEEVGREVKGLEVGDRVVISPPGISCGYCYFCLKGRENMCLNRVSIGYEFDGGFAEYMTIPPEAIKGGCVLKIPEGISLDEAAITEPLACCLNGQEPLAIGSDDFVAIIGAGPIGLMHMQLAQYKGAKKILLIETNSSRLRMATRFGSFIPIDATKEKVREAVLKETEGFGANVVIVACSSGQAQEEALELASKRGRISFFAGLPKNDPYIRLNSNRIHYDELSIFGASASTTRQNRLSLDLITTGRVKVRDLITHKLPLSDILEGIDLVKRGEALKAVINP